MVDQNQIEQLKSSLLHAKEIQATLDRRVYYLRTLYDVSKDIFGTVEPEVILRNFLLMTMGNFGVFQGFILIYDSAQRKISEFTSGGFQEDDESRLHEAGLKILKKKITKLNGSEKGSLIHPSIDIAIRFEVYQGGSGLVGLGQQLTGCAYNKDDEELLNTLINNLVIALKNARSFQEIKSLNKDLQDKNFQLENALTQLRQSMRKVEILESVKENLSKFVPVTVTRMIEKSPSGSVPERKRQDLSVLFADIEGYTRLCEKLGGRETGSIIEKHFSAFMDAIYRNNGDVNETAGDGLMVLFLDKDKKTNAVEAVRAALEIKEKSLQIFKQCDVLYRPLDINMGINSGQALVGAARFETYSGARWTYTATGNLTNVAARIGAQATGGSIFLSKSTADRVKNNYPLEFAGSFNLKNVSQPVKIYKL